MSISTCVRWVIGAGVLALAVVCPPVRADIVQAVKLEDPVTTTGNGGPFKVTFGTYDTTKSGAVGFTVTGADFWTFCLESSEYIYPTQYARYTIDEYAINGLPDDTSGPGNTQTNPKGSNRDPLDDETAWLYYQFRTNEVALFSLAKTLTNNHALTTAAFQQGIQEAIWALEGSGATSNAVGQRLRDHVLSNAVSASEKQYAQARVDVLNLFRLTNGSVLQSQLVLVPLPASVWAGMILLSGYGIVRFRRTARA